MKYYCIKHTFGYNQYSLYELHYNKFLGIYHKTIDDYNWLNQLEMDTHFITLEKFREQKLTKILSAI